ncbi:hypothetical protein OUZ56_029950 [Daphnia magna]|uniref:Uncharacterized protein n=1 Tax=Daphnia magna TaxID=35525 RepID=A0ABR0B8D3_9CRUS|nr:hypothetical protein OUZ56_029950 [Daphnia magna]
MAARMSSSPKSSRFKMEVSVDDQFIPDILLLGGVFGGRIKCLNLQTHERANFHRKKANAIIMANLYFRISMSAAECLSSNSAPHTEVEECLPQDFQPVPIDIHAEDTDSIEDISFDCCYSVNMGNPLSFLKLLQHFAVHTRQKLEHMSYLLKLLKHYQPDPCYDSLPSTGRTLLEINKSFCSSSNGLSASGTTSERQNQSKCDIPQTVEISGGKYLHLGLENALSCSSPGLLFKHSDLLQYVSIYKEDSTLLPTCIRTNVESLYSRLHKSNVKRGLLCGNLERAQSMPTTVEKLPHFEYDIFIDGVQIFKNAEKPTLTPILGRVHSISHCYDSAAPPRRIDNSQPCILGFFQGTSKPNIKKFLRALISELKRLHPKNRNTSETSGRQFTVSLRCIIADTPMRKCTPWEYGGSQVRSLSECRNSYKNHELRRFAYVLLFPVFQGLMVDGDLEHILMIPYFMLLLGAFNPNPVSIQNIEKARTVIKDYVQIVMDKEIPLRYLSHCMIHLPDDVEKYKVGVECLSAFVYENFQGYLRHFLASGNLPVEQLRNRLIERSLYLLPTSADGLILNSDESFEIEASKSVAANEYPNNVCMLRNGSIIIVKDIVEFPTGSVTASK